MRTYNRYPVKIVYQDPIKAGPFMVRSSGIKSAKSMVVMLNGALRKENAQIVEVQ